MKLGNVFHRVAHKIEFSRKSLQGVYKLVNDPKLSQSYYPETDRKPKLSIWLDNFFWLAKHGEVNRYYFVYGLDRKSSEADREVLPYKEFRRIRDSKNLRPNPQGYNYVCILRDKFIFCQFLKSLGFRTPNNVALLNSNEVTWLEDMTTVPYASLVEDVGITINGFCKKLAGTFGEGAFPLRIQNGKLFINDSEINQMQLKERITGLYLLQERITQHPEMSKLHAGSVNTLRIITFNNEGNIRVFSAALRIGTKGRSVDNWSAGGILVGIDIQTGRLQKEGFYKPGYGSKIEKHPDSGIILEGFEIPFFQESIQQVCNLHSYLYGVHSIGWDIAITPDGPIFVEGNDDWDGAVPMAVEKNFKTKFLQMFLNETRQKSTNQH